MRRLGSLTGVRVSTPAAGVRPCSTPSTVSASSTGLPRRCMPHYSTRGPISAHRARYTGSWTRPARSRSGATKSAAPTARGRSCWLPGPTRSGTGTSRSSWAPPSGRISISTSSSTSSAATWSAGCSRRARAPRWSERLIAATCAKQGIEPGHLTVHTDRGAAMTSKPVALLLADLGVTKTHSRPHVSNDNPFSEAQFKTLKYCPAFPERFGSLVHGRAVGHHFFGWYKHDHYHSGLGFLTPAVVHYGQAEAVHAHRTRVLAAAYAAHPERFVEGPPKPADCRRRCGSTLRRRQQTAQDAPGTTSGTPVDLQDPVISRAGNHSAATTINLGATLVTSPFVSQCH